MAVLERPRQTGPAAAVGAPAGHVAPAPPVITSADHATFTEGAAGTFTVTTTAGNPAATTITKTGTLPAGVTFTDNGDGTATLAGTPDARHRRHLPDHHHRQQRRRHRTRRRPSP